MNTLRKMSQMKVGSPMLAGLLYAFIFMLLCTFVLSLLLWLSNFKEQSLTSAAYIIHGIALLIGGFTAAKRSGSKGWYYGGMVGLLYGIIVILVGFLGFDTSFSVQTLFLLGLCLISAALGGMLGVNARK